MLLDERDLPEFLVAEQFEHCLALALTLGFDCPPEQEGKPLLRGIFVVAKEGLNDLQVLAHRQTACTARQLGAHLDVSLARRQ